MRIDPMRTQTAGGATQAVDKRLRRLRVVLLCIVGCVGLWDVTATFGRLAGDLARRGDIHCNAVRRPDGQVLQHNDRCQTAVAPGAGTRRGTEYPGTGGRSATDLSP
jgi:hypothetical protein